MLFSAVQTRKHAKRHRIPLKKPDIASLMSFMSTWPAIVCNGSILNLLKFVSVLDLSLIFIASLGPSASTKVESHVNFTESWKV